MLGLLVATVSFTLLVALVVAALTAVTVVPVFVALQLADTRRFSTARWLVISSFGVLVGLDGAWSLHRHHHLLAVVPLLLTWGGPVMLSLLEEGQTRFGGRAGAHE